MEERNSYGNDTLWSHNICPPLPSYTEKEQRQKFLAALQLLKEINNMGGRRAEREGGGDTALAVL